MSTQVQCSVALIVGGQQICAELVQEAADVHIPSRRCQMQTRAAPVVTNVGVAASLQQTPSETQVPIDTSL